MRYVIIAAVVFVVALCLAAVGSLLFRIVTDR